MAPRIGERGLVMISQNEASVMVAAKEKAIGLKCPTKPGSRRTTWRASRSGHPKTMADQATQTTTAKNRECHHAEPVEGIGRAATQGGDAGDGEQNASGGNSNSAGALRVATKLPRISSVVRNAASGSTISRRASWRRFAQSVHAASGSAGQAYQSNRLR